MRRLGRGWDLGLGPPHAGRYTPSRPPASTEELRGWPMEEVAAQTFQAVLVSAY